jgi:hypothetical protein
MAAINKVSIVFKTHLDVGFTSFAQDVVDTYQNVFFPRAIRVAQELRKQGGREKFVWTTASWILDRCLRDAVPSQKRKLEDAIQRGDLAWHALPFTTHVELMDPQLLRDGIQISKKLDQLFERTTIAAKMTDVPGLTRGAVPILADEGVRFLHLGANPASTTPDVPEIFRWRDDASDKEICVMYHAGGYGKVSVLPQINEAVFFSVTNDNLGPQSVSEVKEIYAQCSELFPNADISAGFMDSLAEKIYTNREKFPLVTQEIGDTWIHGIGSDPKKTSQFRELLRMRNHFVDAEILEPGSPEYQDIIEPLLLISEHTWGMDIKTHLKDFDHWSRDDLVQLRKTESAKRVEESWKEQRNYIQASQKAFEKLPGSAKIISEIELTLGNLAPQMFSLSGKNAAKADEIVDAGPIRFSIDHRGAVTQLAWDKYPKHAFVSPEHPIGLLYYQTFSGEDYSNFYEDYVINKHQVEDWAVPDLSKPGIRDAGAINAEWTPGLVSMGIQDCREGAKVQAQLAFPEQAYLVHGCPRHFEVEYLIHTEEPVIQILVQWFDKAANRLPEAISYLINPIVHSPGRWVLDKLGSKISPSDVVSGGNRRLHGIHTGMYYSGDDTSIEIHSLDAPLVACGNRRYLDFKDQLPDLSAGFNFVLYNNLWGTNFPMWYEEDARFRFSISFFPTG